MSSLDSSMTGITSRIGDFIIHCIYDGIRSTYDTESYVMESIASSIWHSQSIISTLVTSSAILMEHRFDISALSDSCHRQFLDHSYLQVTIADSLPVTCKTAITDLSRHCYSPHFTIGALAQFAAYIAHLWIVIITYHHTILFQNRKP